VLILLEASQRHILRYAALAEEMAAAARIRSDARAGNHCRNFAP
jgi:hypothetical protein